MGKQENKTPVKSPNKPQQQVNNNSNKQTPVEKSKKVCQTERCKFYHFVNNGWKERTSGRIEFFRIDKPEVKHRVSMHCEKTNKEWLSGLIGNQILSTRQNEKRWQISGI
eukprot:c20380_g1_i1.p1 GENE.c20380_g1_i1~~c20380_g1_i1.p1  ORF type:complete len:119 (+),score=36.88 c20380_g1_i1:29-358(+)